MSRICSTTGNEEITDTLEKNNRHVLLRNLGVHGIILKCILEKWTPKV
jgi:hypothetical protein